MKAKNTRIDLQSRSAGQSATGQPVETWPTYATIYGAARSTSTREFSNKGIENEQVIEFTIHYTALIKPEHRALIGAEVFEVVGYPENVEMKSREMILRLRRVG